MESFIHELFGEGTDLNSLQMALRFVLIFFVTFILIRISGRRSFGLRTPIDNIVTITFGAVLSRAIVGASPMIPILVACFTIALIHRCLGWAVSRNEMIARLIEGEKIILFQHGKIHKENLTRALSCREDVIEGLRKTMHTEKTELVDKIYMERNGEIVAVKK